MKTTLIFPHQLYYPSKAISKNRKIFLIEDPLFFFDLKYRFKFHKQKILLHFLSMDSFRKELLSSGYHVTLISYRVLNKNNYYDYFFRKNKIDEIHFLDVHDFELNRRLELASLENKVKINRYETSGFLLSRDQVEEDLNSNKSFLMASFYKKQRRRFNILMEKNGLPTGGKWSFDDDNRKKLPKNIIIPSQTKNAYDRTAFNFFANKVESNFSNNYGTLAGFNYPIDRNQARKSLNHFLELKFKNFGTYEDAISKDGNYLFHSVLSPVINIGLLTPREVINAVNDCANERSVPINSYEGLIRQIIGWREFIRGVYELKGVKQRTENFWGFNKKLPQSFWRGDTGILPLDNSINKINNSAYCHHIERLMVAGNIMVLMNINPDQVYKWFMEMFIDAYDWVMVPNVYGMSQFSDGGLMSTKPYISGSNYILKMSDYPKGDWCQKWDALYWVFINSHRDFFNKNPRMKMMVSMYDKKENIQKMNYNDIINKYSLL